MNCDLHEEDPSLVKAITQLCVLVEEDSSEGAEVAVFWISDDPS